VSNIQPQSIHHLRLLPASIHPSLTFISVLVAILDPQLVATRDFSMLVAGLLVVVTPGLISSHSGLLVVAYPGLLAVTCVLLKCSSHSGLLQCWFVTCVLSVSLLRPSPVSSLPVSNSLHRTFRPRPLFAHLISIGLPVRILQPLTPSTKQLAPDTIP
jgi:hypothetical protein